MSKDDVVADAARSSFNNAIDNNQQLSEINWWCHIGSMNRQYRDWAKALTRYLTVIYPLMTDSERTELNKKARELYYQTKNYSGSDTDDLFFDLNDLERDIRTIQNERGLGFALDEVQQVFEADAASVDKLVKSYEKRNQMISELLAKDKEQQLEDSEEQEEDGGDNLG